MLSGVLLFPCVSCAQVGATWDEVGAYSTNLTPTTFMLNLNATTGLIENPVSFTFDSNGNPVVAAGTGVLPNRGVKLSTFTTGIGTGSDTVGCNVAALQVVALAASDGYAYLPSYQNGACQFVSAGILPGQTVA